MEVNIELISKCGLFCGECRQYKKGKCGGCGKNDKAKWCNLRTCCIDNSYRSCAECKTFTNHNECKKFNNFFSKLFGFLFGSDRLASIKFIKNNGYENYAKEMTKLKQHTIKRR